MEKELVSAKQFFIIGVVNMNSLGYEAINIVKVLMLCFNNGIFQIIVKPTRITRHSSTAIHTNKPQFYMGSFIWYF